MKKIILLALFAATALLFSCAKDEEKAPDYFAESVGEYNVSAAWESLADANVRGIITGTLTVSQAGSVMNFDFGDFQLVAQKLVVAGNGYAFDIRSQNFTDDDGDAYTVSGIAQGTLDGVNYHGRYDTSNKQIYTNWTEVYQNPEYGGIFVEVIASKR